MQKPGFIQRCRLGRGRLEFDCHVGSGSFKRQKESLVRIIAKGIRSGSCAVRVDSKSVPVFMVAGEGFVFSDYQKYLQQLADNALLLPEMTYFNEAVEAQAGPTSKSTSQVNAWFDFENDVLWTLTRDNLEVLVETIFSIKFRLAEQAKKLP